MADTDLILLSVAVVLAGCVYLRHRQLARDCPPEQEWTGHGIDVTGISDRVERVRRNYIIESHSRPHAGVPRKDLLAMTSRAVGCLSYFRKRASRNDVSTGRDTEGHAT
jgi:hypothetical protein